MTSLQMMMRPRRCIEQERATGAPTQKSQLQQLILVLKDTAPLAAATKRNVAAARKLGGRAECCTDAVVKAYFSSHPHSRRANFKDGVLEKLGEGGLRKLTGKKWQWRLFSLNESTLSWFTVKTVDADGRPLPPADDESDVIEPSGSIRMLDVENVWPSAGKSKGRAEENCLQVKALPFWGPEAI
jgi:hypothetical protein